MTEIKITLFSKEYLSKNNIKFTDEALQSFLDMPITLEDKKVIGVIKDVSQANEDILVRGLLFDKSFEFLPSFISDGNGNLKLSSMGLFSKK